MKFSRFAFVCLLALTQPLSALAADPIRETRELADKLFLASPMPPLPTGFLQFHAVSAYFSGVRLMADSALECKGFGESGTAKIGLAPSPSGGAGEPFSGVTARGDIVTLNIEALNGRTHFDYTVRGYLQLGEAAKAELAVMGEPIGAAFDLFTSPEDPMGGPRGIDGGRVYLITSQEKNGICHGIILDLVPAGMGAFVEDNRQPKSVEQPVQRPAPAQEPAQPKQQQPIK